MRPQGCCWLLDFIPVSKVMDLPGDKVLCPYKGRKGLQGRELFALQASVA